MHKDFCIKAHYYNQQKQNKLLCIYKCLVNILIFFQDQTEINYFRYFIFIDCYCSSRFILIVPMLVIICFECAKLQYYKKKCFIYNTIFNHFIINDHTHYRTPLLIHRYDTTQKRSYTHSHNYIFHNTNFFFQEYIIFLYNKNTRFVIVE